MTRSKFKVVRLDRRFKAWSKFDHYVEPNQYPASDLYLAIREWCWETYGPGADINMIVQYNPPERAMQYKWAWQDDENRLYLNNTELTHFQLKWG